MRQLILLICASPLLASVSGNVQWDVRPTLGASTNGGGYTIGTTGTTTNYATNNNKNAAGCTSCGSSTVDISTTDAVAIGTTTITSATGNFSAVKGNVVYFSGGTGSIAATRREVISVTNSTTFVVDVSVAASTGMTMNIGGALDTIDTALLFNVSANTICVKSTATITRATTLTLNNATGTPFNALFGYAATCGDHGPATLQMITNTGFSAITGANGWWIDGFVIDCNSLGTSTGYTGQQAAMLTNSKIENCTSTLLNSASGYGTFLDNEFTGCTSACSAALTIASPSVLERNFIHDNATLCVNVASGFTAFNYNVVANCTGSLSDGIHIDLGLSAQHNIFYNMGRDSLATTGSAGHTLFTTSIRNNIFDTAARYCFNAGNVEATPQFDGNFYFGCVTANRFQADKSSSQNYTNIYDHQLTADPFVSAAGNSFALNSTAGGGATVKAAGTPGVIPGVTGTGFPDGGTFQGASAVAATPASAYAQ